MHSCKPLGVVAMRGRQRRPFELRERRLQFRRPHIGPQNPAALDQRIGLQLDLAAEAAFGRLRRHLDALAGVVVFPAVIGAAQPVVLVPPEPQRHAAMRAELVGQRETALRVAPGQQPLGQKLDPHRRAFVLRQLLGVHRRNPIAAEHLAHRRAGAGLGRECVLLRPEHEVLLESRASPIRYSKRQSHLRRRSAFSNGALRQVVEGAIPELGDRDGLASAARAYRRYLQRAPSHSPHMQRRWVPIGFTKNWPRTGSGLDVRFRGGTLRTMQIKTYRQYAVTAGALLKR